MFFGTNAQSTTTTRKATYARGVVECSKCRRTTPVYRVEAVSDEFSVRCSQCGHRGFYRKNEMGIQQLPERRSKKR
ncbi:MAG: hypothetical protein HXX10_14330 [Rhodoplanes sp.]|uniref:hypothetical protein n=1 Tax=Rhodoplanes sp. TaxID=1968906 RepID=UPI00183765DA|nr:hypothetical protein [Rhodoplanes sp.]NVO15208.1 hypothetical protein [Rhodoplanes sp.]